MENIGQFSTLTFSILKGLFLIVFFYNLCAVHNHNKHEYMYKSIELIQ